jgi:hypothetical protein
MTRQAAFGVPPKAAPSSLVPSSESVGEIEPGQASEDRQWTLDDLCPKRPVWVVCDQDPALRFPASCDAYYCPTCGPRKARTAAAALTWALRQVERRRLVTLTGLPDDWQRARAQVRDWLYRIRHEGYDFEMGWCIEQNPRLTGLHAHGCQHGDYVPQKLLQDRWGGRIVDVRALSRPGAGVYAMKEALRVAGYVAKGATHDQAALEDHLERNGGRVLHTTRGYYHGLTKREALVEVGREFSQGEVRTWHLEPREAAVA